MASDLTSSSARRNHKRTHAEMSRPRSLSRSQTLGDTNVAPHSWTRAAPPPNPNANATRILPPPRTLHLPTPIPRPEPPSSSSSSSSSSNTPQHRSLQQHPPPMEPPQRRFRGDGFDFRRPMRPSAVPSVIDLTSDTEASPETTRNPPQQASQEQQRRSAGLPRFPNAIIDLSNDDTPAVDAGSRASTSTRPTAPGAGTAAPSSPEVQFVGSRPRTNPVPPQDRQARWRSPPEMDFEDIMMNEDFMDVVDLLDDNEGDDEVEYVRTTVLPRTRPPLHLREIVERRGQEGLGRYLGRLVSRGIIRNVAAREPDDDDFGFLPHLGARGLNIGVMNYGMAAFDLGIARREERQPSPPPPYQPPPEAPAGFTRSPQETDVLICPNCGDELCTGGSDLKRQVWIVRGCGHTYCGSCTAYRAKSKRKGKAPAQESFGSPFARCVVEGCEKSCTAKGAMIQLFL